ncbi:PREDICTED: trithorax group protein osa-like, partial [Priapulus caudatus]|uniref:Trithorax group protein osa-like n=1 Tax=Priapulus caudatus TaxID=37621 RepID=A0ABM1EZ28_PRICU
GPTINKNQIDLYKLYLAVRDRGGFLEVTRAKLWKDIAAHLKVSISASAAYTVRKHFVKHLLPYACKFDHGGVDPQSVLSQLESQASRNKKQRAEQSRCAPSPAGSSNSQDSFGAAYGAPGMEGYNQYPPPGGAMEYNQGMYGPGGGLIGQNAMAGGGVMMPPGGMAAYGQQMGPPPPNSMYVGERGGGGATVGGGGGMPVPPMPAYDRPVPPSMGGYSRVMPPPNAMAGAPNAMGYGGGGGGGGAGYGERGGAAGGGAGGPLPNVMQPFPADARGVGPPTSMGMGAPPSGLGMGAPPNSMGAPPSSIGMGAPPSGMGMGGGMSMGAPHYAEGAGMGAPPGGVNMSGMPMPPQGMGHGQQMAPQPGSQDGRMPPQQQHPPMAPPSDAGQQMAPPPPTTVKETVAVQDPFADDPPASSTPSFRAPPPVGGAGGASLASSIGPAPTGGAPASMGGGAAAMGPAAAPASSGFGKGSYSNSSMSGLTSTTSSYGGAAAGGSVDHGMAPPDVPPPAPPFGRDAYAAGYQGNQAPFPRYGNQYDSHPRYTDVPPRPPSQDGPYSRYANYSSTYQGRVGPQQREAYGQGKRHPDFAKVTDDAYGRMAPWQQGSPSRERMQPGMPAPSGEDSDRLRAAAAPPAKQVNGDAERKVAPPSAARKINGAVEEADREGATAPCQNSLRCPPPPPICVGAPPTMTKSDRKRRKSATGGEGARAPQSASKVMENGFVVADGDEKLCVQKLLGTARTKNHIKVEPPVAVTPPPPAATMTTTTTTAAEEKTSATPPPATATPSGEWASSSSGLEDEAYRPDEASLVAVADGDEHLVRRCVTISNIVRSLSFVPGNDAEMSRQRGLLHVVGRLLLLRHRHDDRRPKQPFGGGAAGEEEDDAVTRRYCTSLDTRVDAWASPCVDALRENALVTLTNVAGRLHLMSHPESIVLPILDGLLHWVVCPSSYARDALPTTTAAVALSPQRLALEALAKMSIQEHNVDLLLATPPYERLEAFFALLAANLARAREQPTREMSVVLLSNLVAADTAAARAVAGQRAVVPNLLAFLEEFEANALAVANAHGVAALRDGPEIMGTSLDMLRRAAGALACLARGSAAAAARPLLARYQPRLLHLVMSQILDQQVALLVSDVLYEVTRGSS